MKKFQQLLWIQNIRNQNIFQIQLTKVLLTIKFQISVNIA